MIILYINILSWLLFHANRKPSKEFYEIKNRILAKYGKHICYDVQHFHGVKCDTCRGTGKFKCFWKLPETCWSCMGSGWYKPESWVILSKIRFGKYDSFHQPLNRVYEKPDFSNQMIEGYIDKKPTTYSSFALFVLVLCYEKGYLKRWYQSQGNGWRLYWWLPRTYLNNIIHLLKKGRNAYPIKQYRSKIERKRISRQMSKPNFYPSIESDELPF